MKKKGFTLIELLAVCAIIFMISSVVYANIVVEPRNQANDAHAQVEVAEVAKAIKTKALDGNPPRNYVGGTVSSRTTPAREGTDSYNRSMQELVNGKFYPEIPTSPDGESYFYFYDEAKNEGVFGAILKSKRENRSSNNGCIVSNGKSCSVNEDLFDSDNKFAIIFKSIGLGECGQANGATYSTDSAPTGNLCNNGIESIPTAGQSGWSWECLGETTATCSASFESGETFAGECGSGNGQTYSENTPPPSETLCNFGTATVPVNNNEGSWVWECSGLTPASCSANLTLEDNTVASCGPIQEQLWPNGSGMPQESDLCSTGESNNFNFIPFEGSFDSIGNWVDGNYEWSCSYTNSSQENNNVSCFARTGIPASNYACGPTNGSLVYPQSISSSLSEDNLCNSNDLTSSNFNGYGWNWTCNYNNVDHACSATWYDGGYHEGVWDFGY